MKKIMNNHGGKRPGSGRKQLEPEQRKQKVTFALSIDVIEFLRSHKPASQTLEKAIREYAKKFNL